MNIYLLPIPEEKLSMQKHKSQMTSNFKMKFKFNLLLITTLMSWAPTAVSVARLASNKVCRDFADLIL